MKELFCRYCGFEHDMDVYPKTCSSCNIITWDNPLPVTVVLVPIGDGLLLVRRNIVPHIGGLAFPGGYAERGETWQEASSREVFEETGIIIEPNDLTLLNVETSNNGNYLIFSKYNKVLDASELNNFNNNSEVQEIMSLNDAELCFPLHQEYFRNYFKNE